VWCPSCGAEYRAGTTQCADCRVALAVTPPEHFGDTLEETGEESALVEMGEWPRIQAQILRRRLESANVPVMIEYSDAEIDATGVLIVPEEHAEFAAAVINEVDVDDEVPDTSPYAYITRLEEHLSAAAELIGELRTRLDQLEAEGKL
jgi:hypothetical protein